MNVHPKDVALFERLHQLTGYPLVAMAILTDRCNLSCGHCYESSTSVIKKDLLTEEWINLMDQLAEVGTLFMVFSGGEPTLHPDFLTLVEAAAERRFAVSLKTNGTLLTKKTTQKCWDLGLSKLEVSLYHDDPSDHDKFVGMLGAFDKATQTLREFQRVGGRVRVNIIAMRWNAPRIPHLLDICDREGWEYVVDFRVNPRIDGSLSPYDLRAGPEQMVDTFSDKRLLERVPNSQKKTLDRRVCGAGKQLSIIRPNGDIWPCRALPVVLGNIRTEPYREILSPADDGARFTPPLWKDSVKCGTCNLLHHCVRCPGTSMLEHGDPSIPTSFDCQVAKVFADIIATKASAKPDA
jgi:radical SAM protein with 4Fe4S-binding SPASM domain